MPALQPSQRTEREYRYGRGMNADRPGQDGVHGPVASSPLDETRGREALTKA